MSFDPTYEENRFSNKARSHGSGLLRDATGIKHLLSDEFYVKAPKQPIQGVALYRRVFLGYLTGRQDCEVRQITGSPCDHVREA